jgi:hypothetical protein
MTDAATTKRCPKHDDGVGRDLPIDAFGTNASAPDGLQSWCKGCRNRHRRRVYQESEEAKRNRARGRAMLATVREHTGTFVRHLETQLAAEGLTIVNPDSTQLFDPESHALNPRAANGDGGEAGEHVQQVTPLEYDEDAWGQPPISDGQREHARNTDPATSKRAAQGRDKNSTVGRGTQKHTLLAAYNVEGPMTADEACEHTRMLRAWRRVYDLLNGGFLADTGDERPSRQGRAQRVLKITRRGKAALALFAKSDAKVYRP